MRHLLIAIFSVSMVLYSFTPIYAAKRAPTDPVQITTFVNSRRVHLGSISPRLYQKYDVTPPTAVIHESIVQIVSNVDALTIEDIKINRGNCKIEKYNFPKTLKFGQGFDFIVKDQNANLCEHIVEIAIKTNLGNWSYSQIK